MEYNYIGMKKYTLFALLPTLILAGKAFADVNTNVNISSNGSNSSSRVTVNNNVNTSSNATSTTNSRTDIKIETNGNLQEYHSDKPGSISVQSDNGVSQVKINGATIFPSKSSAVGEKNIQTSGAANITHEATKEAGMKKTSQQSFFAFINKQIQIIKDFFSRLKIF